MDIEFGWKNKAGKIGLGVKLFMTVLFLFFAAFSAFFAVFVGREAYKNIRTFLWNETRCLVLSSRVEQRQGNYYFTVKYRYQAGGRAHISTRYSPDYAGSSDYQSAAQISQTYRPKSRTVCYVNPSDPAQAVLAHGSPWVALMLIFPLIFGTIGVGGLYFVWRGRGRVRKRAQQATQVESISESGAKKDRGVLLYIVFAIFFLVGTVGFYLMALAPAIKILEARDWIRTPCLVVDSRLRSHTGSDTTTYRIDILYAYTFKGKRYKSNRYDFMKASSSGYDRKKEIVKRNPPGTLTACYVNPDNPGDAVLDRSLNPELRFGLIPLLFAFVGGGGILYQARKRKRNKGLGQAIPAARAPAIYYQKEPSVGVAGTVLSDEPVTLQVKGSRIRNLGLSIVFAVVWNGIMSVFVWQAVQSWLEGPPNWFLTIFLIPFVLIGIASIVNVPYQLLVFFNPRPILTLHPGAPRLGESVELTWRIEHRAKVISSLEIEVKGREEADYTRGTSTYTDKDTFARIPVAQPTHRTELTKGYAAFDIPADSMHSFKSDNNRIIWSIQVKGGIKFWPDINDEYEITVRPQAARI
jgi:hypothetical protein